MAVALWNAATKNATAEISRQNNAELRSAWWRLRREVSGEHSCK